jgi:predicted nucleic acid-binding protein
MAVSRKVFIDSSVLYSFIDRADANHAQTVKTIEQLSLQEIALFTSLQAIQDTFNAVNRQLGSTLGYDFLEVITQSNIEILFPQKSDLITAHRIMKTNRMKQMSLKDVITAVLMQKKGIVRILTYTYWPNILGSESYFYRV